MSDISGSATTADRWTGSHARLCDFCHTYIALGQSHACNEMLAHKLDAIFTFLVAKFPEVASRLGGDR